MQGDPHTYISTSGNSSVFRFSISVKTGPSGLHTSEMNFCAWLAQSHENAWTKGTRIWRNAQIGASAPEQSVPTRTRQPPELPDTNPGVVFRQSSWTSSTDIFICGPQLSKRCCNEVGSAKLYFLADGFLLIVGRGVRANVDVDAAGGLHVDVLTEVDADGLLRMGAGVALHAGAGGGPHGRNFLNPSITNTPGHADTPLQARASK